MAEPGTPVIGQAWCLRSIDLPHGTRSQVLAWLDADPRPGAIVLVTRATPDEVQWTPHAGRGSTFRLPRAEFLERFQPVHGQDPTPEQVPPERPPQNAEERTRMMLDGWWH